jgi:hypothetical protein
VNPDYETLLNELGMAIHSYDDIISAADIALKDPRRAKEMLEEIKDNASVMVLGIRRALKRPDIRVIT